VGWGLMENFAASLSLGVLPGFWSQRCTVSLASWFATTLHSAGGQPRVEAAARVQCDGRVLVIGLWSLCDWTFVVWAD